MSKKTSRKNTFGWARAEVLGALVNSVFLVALCFTIFVEAIQRLTHSHHIEHVDSMIYVGVAGFIVNVLGLILFCGQGQGQSADEEDRVGCQLDDVSHQHSPGSATYTAVYTIAVMFKRLQTLLIIIITSHNRASRDCGSTGTARLVTCDLC